MARKQLDLHRGRDVADLVQQHRAAVGELEQPLAILDRPGERAAQMPEQFALDQPGAEGRQANRQERAVPPGAVAMDGAGHQLLARAALASDQNGNVGRRHQGDLLEQLLHGR